MAKISIDTDKITNELIPQAKRKYVNIKNASILASKISLDSDYNWSSIRGQIDDCSNITVKYINWLDSINTEYNNNFTNKQEEIDSLEIGEITSSFL